MSSRCRVGGGLRRVSTRPMLESCRNPKIDIPKNGRRSDLTQSGVLGSIDGDAAFFAAAGYRRRRRRNLGVSEYDFVSS